MMFTMNREWSLPQRPLSTGRTAALWVVVLGTALFSGSLAAGRADAVLGAKPSRLLLAALVGCAFLIVFVFLGSSALLVWPVAATGGYLLQLPRDQPVFTFDRVWIGGLIAYIALTPRTVARTPATRLIRFSLLLFVFTFGVRALTTSAANNGPLNRWLDAIVLPAILFFACERYCSLGADRLRRLSGALMLAGGVLGVIGIAERIFGFELATLTGGGAVRFDAGVDATRISGPYPAPEPYALTLLICFAATLYWILSRKQGSRYFWALVIAAVEVAAISLALFRAGWIAGVLILITSFGLRPGRFGRLFTVAAVACVVGFFATAQLQQNKTVAQRVGNTQNIYNRLATYEQGFEIFRSAPLFGVGIDKYHAAAEERPPVYVSGAPSVTYPHSSFVGLLGEQGIVGFVPFVLLFYALWRLLVGLRAASFRESRAALVMATAAGAVLAYLIMSLTLTMLPYEPPNAFFAAFLGGAAGYLDFVARKPARPLPDKRPSG
jgi:O-antigen ligase